MAQCVDIVNVALSGTGKVDRLAGGSITQVLAPSITQTIDTCTTYVLQTATEYQTLSDIGAVFATYFQFDAVLSEIIMTALLIAFLSGHVLGRIISGLRKAG